MSIQALIDDCQYLTINRRATTASTISRSKRLKTSERGYRVWEFNVVPSPGYQYDTNRDLLEQIDTVDRITEEQISFSNNSGLAYITEYKGDMSQLQADAITISSVSGTTITLTDLPTAGSSTILFAKGDYIQPAGSRYPYTVINTVYRGTETTVDVEVNRGVIEDITMAGASIYIGDAISWRVKALNMPTYSIAPGRHIVWEGDLLLMEVIV